jgi:predicted S18 family serine protease
MRWLLLALILASSVFAIECEGSVSLGLPAVSGNEEAGNGAIVPVEIRLVPGGGGAYINAIPNTDTDLQESFSTAMELAREYADDGGECDALLSINDNSEFVQGPSGGAAFTVMGYALFGGIGLGGDATMTGAISEEGGVLPVGGLYEKAMSAKRNGKDYFLTPIQSVDEKLMLSGIDGITIYEVETIEEAIGFFFEGKIPQERPLNLSVEPLLPLEEYAGKKDARFRELTEAIIEREELAVEGLEDESLRAYYGELASQQRELIEKGYYYSAANGGFLNFIIANSLSQINEPDVEGKISEVEACMAGIGDAELTYENYEWIMGAQAREKRAGNQLETYRDNGARTREEKYILVHNLNYALAWCEAASGMQGIAEEIGGEPMEPGILKASADELINLSANYSEIEESENYANGMEMYEDGAYAGAAYELLYALAFEKTYDLVDSGERLDVASLNYGERETLWGSVFQAHSDYLSAYGDEEGAYAVALFSYGMEEIGGEVEEAMAGGPFMGNGVEEDECGLGDCECECPECSESPCVAALILLAASCMALFGRPGEGTRTR